MGRELLPLACKIMTGLGWGYQPEAPPPPERCCRIAAAAFQSVFFFFRKKASVRILGSCFPSVWECQHRSLFLARPAPPTLPLPPLPLLISPKCRVLCVLFPGTPAGSRGAASQTWESEMRWLFILPVALGGCIPFLFFFSLLLLFPSSFLFLLLSFFFHEWCWNAA